MVICCCNMGRVIGLQSELLERLRSGRIPKWELAERLGIGEGVLNGLLDDSWTVMDRRVLERLIDEIGCTPGELFTVTESPFFDRLRAIGLFKGTPRCY